MTGRPRNTTAKRGSTGRIKTGAYAKQFDSAAVKWRRIRDTLRSIAETPRLTGELGRLHFVGDITSAQYQAGLSFGAMLEVYDWKILGIRRTVAAHVLDKIGGTDGAEGWDEARIQEFKSRFSGEEGVDTRLKAEMGRDVHRDTVALCRGEWAPLATASVGLSWLVGFFRIDKTLDGEAQIVNRAKSKVAVATN